MNTTFAISDSFVAEQNRKAKAWLDEDYEHLGRQLQRRGVEIEDLTDQAQSFKVAVPSWGVGTGGTRFARYPGPGEPRGVYEKLEDCATINRLVALYETWGRSDRAAAYRAQLPS